MEIDEVIIGNVLQAGQGQNPARIAACEVVARKACSIAVDELVSVKVGFQLACRSWSLVKS